MGERETRAREIVEKLGRSGDWPLSSKVAINDILRYGDERAAEERERILTSEPEFRLPAGGTGKTGTTEPGSILKITDPYRSGPPPEARQHIMIDRICANILRWSVLVALLIGLLGGCSGWKCGPDPERPGVRCVQP